MFYIYNGFTLLSLQKIGLFGKRSRGKVEQDQMGPVQKQKKDETGYGISGVPASYTRKSKKLSHV